MDMETLQTATYLGLDFLGLVLFATPPLPALFTRLVPLVTAVSVPVVPVPAVSVFSSALLLDAFFAVGAGFVLLVVERRRPGLVVLTALLFFSRGPRRALHLAQLVVDVLVGGIPS
jgi:hypothetical protein